MPRLRLLLLISLAPMFLMSPNPLSTQARGQVDDQDISHWPLELLEVADGPVYRGVVVAESEGETEFAEIIRPAGKPMFAVIHPVPSNKIHRIERLKAKDHENLLRQFERFRYRTRIEAGSMESLQLKRTGSGNAASWQYVGPWFDLESTADEVMTRRSIVRVEQIFRAYRQLLPADHPGETGLKILILGSMDDYRGLLRSWGFAVSGPAFYSAGENLIVAGSDLNAFSERLREASLANSTARKDYEQLMESFPKRLSDVLERMRKAGYGEEEIEREAKLRRTVWQREYDAALARLNLADYRNAAKFDEVTSRMFRQLYHEAFHAYVANYAYSSAEHTMPRWLNEGLAQVFESAQLDAGTLRVDAPDRLRLDRLQRDLQGETSLRVASVLAADEQSFLSLNGNSDTQQIYLYSWGLAYYLAFESKLLGARQLGDYVRNEREFGPPARFASLVGESVDKFEARWRDAMLSLSPNG